MLSICTLNIFHCHAMIGYIYTSYSNFTGHQTSFAELLEGNKQNRTNIVFLGCKQYGLFCFFLFLSQNKICETNHVLRHSFQDVQRDPSKAWRGGRLFFPGIVASEYSHPWLTIVISCYIPRKLPSYTRLIMVYGGYNE